MPPKPLHCWGFAAPTPATVKDMTPDFWVVSWSAVFGLAFVIAVRAAVTTDVTCQPFGLWANEDSGGGSCVEVEAIVLGRK